MFARSNVVHVNTNLQRSIMLAFHI